ncbi:MAG: hypothetical protein ACE5OZ_11420 [Candidatus Heimdallarchaeota archaeon]
MLTPSNLPSNEVVEPGIISQTSSEDESVRVLLQEIQNEYERLALDPLVDGRWRSLSEIDLWLLLCRCILSTEMHYERALTTVEILWQNGHLNPYMIADFGENGLTAKLAALLGNNSKKGRQYSKYFVANAKQLRKLSISWLLSHSESDEQAREKLCKHFKGVGLLEATMFLRDSCYARSLVVVDTSLVRFLKMVTFVEPDFNVSKIRPKTYRLFEYLFRGYCENRQVDHQRLERAIWKTMQD